MWYYYFLWIHPVLTAMGSTEWLSVGVGLVAAIQLYLTNATERRQRLERKRTEDHETAVAWNGAFAEAFRIHNLVELWREVNIVELAARDLLRPDILLLDTRYAEHVAQLGGVSTKLGTAVLTHSRELALAISVVCDDVKRAMGGMDPLDPRTADLVARKIGPRLEEKVVAIRRSADQLRLLMSDVVDLHPHAHIPRAIEFIAEPKSDLARGLRESLGLPVIEAPPVKSWRSRLGFGADGPKA